VGSDAVLWQQRRDKVQLKQDLKAGPGYSRAGLHLHPSWHPSRTTRDSSCVSILGGIRKESKGEAKVAVPVTRSASDCVCPGKSNLAQGIESERTA